MRAPFASESRCVFNLFQLKWGDEKCCAPPIISETIAEPPNPRGKPWFNCDFILHFDDWRMNTSERSVAACSVLPSALGAELFLIVERDTLSPTALELNGGGAFSIEHYARYIDVVEAGIQEGIDEQGCRQPDHPWHRASTLIPINKAAFARCLVVGRDVTFLYFPH